MSGPSIVLATASNLHKADGDEAPLRAALADAGIETQVLAWDDASAQAGFAGARACILRSTWNYVANYARFLPWVDWCAGVTALFNPAAAIRWNSHKQYLLALEARGIPIVPTRLVPKGAATTLAALIEDGDVVVLKPAISAGSFATVMVARSDLATGEAHLAAMLRDRDMLVQPYQRSVNDYGERALIYFGGVFSHAVRKGARFAGQREDVSPAVPATDDERALAEQVLAAAPGPLLYARVDLVRDDGGRPRLMELELIEPSLFLDRTPTAAARFASAIASRL